MKAIAIAEIDGGYIVRRGQKETILTISRGSRAVDMMPGISEREMEGCVFLLASLVLRLDEAAHPATGEGV